MAYDNGDRNSGNNLLDHIRDGHLPCSSFIKLFLLSCLRELICVYKYLYL